MKPQPQHKPVYPDTPVTIGLLAHVDAGKTTLAEAMLYTAGKLRKIGRVDHRDAYLDTHDLEKQRGITIFSKQAQMQIGSRQITLLDTPGHVDFSPETERTLQVLDYAILVISGSDGIQPHVRTLWRLLKHHRIPVFLFVNKMDLQARSAASLMKELQAHLSDACIDFSDTIDATRNGKTQNCTEEQTGTAQNSTGKQTGTAQNNTEKNDAFFEGLATCSEQALEQYVETGTVHNDEIRTMIAQRQVFPCFFGSALKLQGIETFLQALQQYLLTPARPDAFGARVFKISRDERGERLTHLKVTGGSLKVRSMLTDPRTGEQEKINQIRIYDGASFQSVQEAAAGSICTVTGLRKTRCGDGFGFETDPAQAQLVPVMTYRILLPAQADVHRAVTQLQQLEEEEPQLHVIWKEQSDEIQVQVMGEVQLEILRSLIRERFDLDVSFGPGSIIYKETISRPTEGVGHFEPLQHYAEVHLLLEPGARGSGMVVAADCSEDLLARSWQRLILTHLQERTHVGVLTASALTDIKITLKSGRAHPKHTEGGDFRQATYRAVRQGLMQTESLLLEPYYTFRLEVPADQTGRAMNDIQRMSGQTDPLQTAGGTTILTGRAPVSTMRDYPAEVISYTRGMGRISCAFGGYDVCHNTEEIIAACGYDPERDTENPADSVFCSHGSGYIVPWNEVPAHMHLPSVIRPSDDAAGADGRTGAVGSRAGTGRADSPGDSGMAAKDYGAADRELQAIFERTYGSGTFSRSNAETAYTQTRRRSAAKRNAARRSTDNTASNSDGTAAGRADSGRRTAEVGFDKTGHRQAAAFSGETAGADSPDGSDISSDRSVRARRKNGSSGAPHPSYLLVDGYNIIFAWDELRNLAKESAEAARGRLMDILCNYQGYHGMTLILVFDAYRVAGNPGESFRYHNIHVVYTKEAETADQYIEKTVHEIGHKYDVTVATSDRLEQIIIFGSGARRMSASELQAGISAMSAELHQDYLDRTTRSGAGLFDGVTEETMRQIREAAVSTE